MNHIGTTTRYGRSAFLLLQFSLVLAATSVAKADTLRVPLEHATIHAAIEAASDGDTIVLSAGEYVIRETISFFGKDLHLLGEDGPAATTVRMSEPIDAERGSVFIFENAESRNAIVEGITISSGTGTVASRIVERARNYTGKMGGGVFCGSHAEPRFVNNVFESNVGLHAGAVFVDIDAQPQFIDNRFISNRSDAVIVMPDSRVTIRGGSFERNEGAALLMELSSILIIDDVLFLENESNFESALIHYGEFLALSNCRFVRNKTGGVGGALNVQTSDPAHIANIENCEFWNNTAGRAGGAVFAFAINDGFRPIRFARCLFVENESQEGGGIFVDDDSNLVSIERCRFVANHAKNQGGGVYVDYEGAARIHDSSFIGNVASNGGGIAFDEPSLEITNCCIVGNSATTGGGAHSYRDRVPVDRSIVWGNSGGDLVGPSVVTESCLGTLSEVPAPDANLRLGDPGFIGWERENYNVDASAEPDGDGSPEKPLRSLVEVLLQFSFDLNEDSRCLQIGGDNQPGLTNAGAAPRASRPTTQVSLHAGSYSTPGLALLGIRGENRDSTFLVGTAWGMRGGRALENLTVTDGSFGGIVLANGDEAVFRNCRVTRQFSALGSIVTAHPESEGIFENCDLSHNSSTVAPIWSSDSDLRFESCTILGNRSNALGIATLMNGIARFHNCLFVGGHETGANQNLFRASLGEIELVHCTLAQNSSRKLVDCLQGAKFKLYNSLLWLSGDLSSPCIENVASLRLTESPFIQAAELDFSRTENIIVGGILHVLPDYFLSNGDYRLRADSPALDVGDENLGLLVDMERNPRPCRAGFDLGAFESGCADSSFVRGDSDQDGRHTIGDPILTLRFLFLGGEEPHCLDALDANDDGRLTLTDAVRTLGFLFLGEIPPADPFLVCGTDPIPDALSCESFAICAF